VLQLNSSDDPLINILSHNPLSDTLNRDSTLGALCHQCIAERCRALQCVAVCCSVLQCVTW